MVAVIMVMMPLLVAMVLMWGRHIDGWRWEGRQIACAYTTHATSRRRERNKAVDTAGH
jgi:hypothetical protein